MGKTELPPDFISFRLGAGPDNVFAEAAYPERIFVLCVGKNVPVTGRCRVEAALNSTVKFPFRRVY